MSHSRADAHQVWLCALLAAVTAGCAAGRQLLYTPAALRDEVVRRAPQLAGRAVVPFEVTPEQVERARRIVGTRITTSLRANALLAALSDPHGLGLRYLPARTVVAADAIESGGGNCLSLASVVVGLARGLGMQAYYVDVSDRVEDVLHHGDLTVRSGHVTAIIRTETGFSALDVGGRTLATRGYWNAMSDLEVVAHYFNNRGYELIYDAEASGAPVAWPEVAESFALATRILPGFARAWNNLGVAHGRTGDLPQAITAFEAAIAADPGLLAARANLASLLLGRGELDRAESVLRDAAARGGEQAELEALGRRLRALRQGRRPAAP